MYLATALPPDLVVSSLKSGVVPDVGLLILFEITVALNQIGRASCRERV